MEAQVREIAFKYLNNVRELGEDNLRAECPFHDSRSATRSLAINVRTGVWLCFNEKCGARGALVQLLRRLGMSGRQVDLFMEHLQLPPPVPEGVRKKAAINKVWDLLPEYILGAYEQCPLQLVDAGFSEELLQQNDVGYDALHDRITFAIRDYHGRLVAISGRACEDRVVPRYKVYDARPPDPELGRPAGELFGVVEKYVPDNRRHLYGFHSVYPERFFRPAAEWGPLVITEGYKSTLWLRQLGFTHSVGLQGSSLSAPQLRMLNKLRGPYYVMLDHEPGKSFPDKNGRCAAVQIAEQLKTSGKVLLCRYHPDTKIGTAPDDLQHDTIDHMVKNAKTLGQYALER